MSKVIRTAGDARLIGAEIQRVIRSANKELFIISPFIKTFEKYKDCIEEAIRKNCNVTVVYGKGEWIDNSKQDYSFYKYLSDYRNFSLKYLDRLHAKIYFNENTAIISSMNFYASSENNFEVAVKIDRADEPEQFNIVRDEIEDIVNESEEQPLIRYSNSTGYCIRCGARIPLNRERPLCAQCYNTWVLYKDGGYPEQYCHYCGKYADSSFDRPFHPWCFKKYNSED